MKGESDGMVAAVVTIVLLLLPMMSGVMFVTGRQSGRYDILSQAQKQGVLTITVDPLTLKRTHVWYDDANRQAAQVFADAQYVHESISKDRAWEAGDR
jgi:hypothetical protein